MSISIPESVAIRLFNERTGANCKTLEETQAYLHAHPEVRHKLDGRHRARPAAAAPTQSEPRDEP